MARPARRAAWQAYLLVTLQLLPAVRDAPVGDRDTAILFADLIAHLRTHARSWAAAAPRFSAVTGRAWDMYRHGDRAGAAVLLRVLAGWLFHLSRGSTTPREGQS
jgi:hypothetical protein